MSDIQMIEDGLHNRYLETATFGMGCFWGPESRFGGLQGVMRTRVGYAGGTTEKPTYRTLGNHTESLQIDFDPEIIRFEEVLRHFWRNHYPNRDEYKGRQYISLLLYHNEDQRQTIEKLKIEMEEELGERIETEIKEYEKFTIAEERHQKYYLKRYPKALEQLRDIFTSNKLLNDSTFAARLDGFVKGFISRDELKREIDDWPIDQIHIEMLNRRLLQMKW